MIDAGVGVCLRPRVAAGFIRLSAAFEAQGRHADVVRACFLVRYDNNDGWSASTAVRAPLLSFFEDGLWFVVCAVRAP